MSWGPSCLSVLYLVSEWYPFLSWVSTKSYDFAIYVMKWLEIIQPENVKKGKYEWDNWTQDEVDHYRVKYASWILFHEMNQDKAEAIRGSDINSNDIDTV
ncbi:hypothetical protein AHAS_Ahas11G0266500 [Arachis hypogaea]